MVIQTRVFGRYFLEVKWAFYFKEKQLIAFIVNYKIQAFKSEENFGNLVSATISLILHSTHFPREIDDKY